MAEAQIIVDTGDAGLNAEIVVVQCDTSQNAYKVSVSIIACPTVDRQPKAL